MHVGKQFNIVTSKDYLTIAKSNALTISSRSEDIIETFT
jgi:hypothetical protein